MTFGYIEVQSPSMFGYLSIEITLMGKVSRLKKLKNETTGVVNLNACAHSSGRLKLTMIVACGTEAGGSYRRKSIKRSIIS